MKYFLDTEFIEGFKKPLFGKRMHFIDLISIGIVAEDGREYYAVSNQFNPNDANDWVKENVIASLPDKELQMAGPLSPSGMVVGGPIWKSNEQIKKDILTMFGCWQDQHFWRAPEGIEVYGYYADYDWVLFCSLFGTMMDLPRGLPMYCRDLKQELDELTNWELIKKMGTNKLTFNQQLDILRSDPMYPIAEIEHHALEDARWNQKLYNFIETF